MDAGNLPARFVTRNLIARRVWQTTERSALSRRGWLTVSILVLLLAVVVLLRVQPFLAVTHRTDANILVVEGWVHQFAIDGAVAEFRDGHYEHVFATGGPVEGSGGYTSDYQTSAQVGASRLRTAGIPKRLVQMVPSHVMERDRTYNAAVALREWFHEHHMNVHRINVVTEDVHARRTRLLFQEALGKSVVVGIISVPNPDYDTKHWWRYSEGIREILGESIAYLYAKVLFWPPSK